MARLCSAYYEVAAEANENLWWGIPLVQNLQWLTYTLLTRDFVKPFVHNWVIAASLEQCLQYPDKLYVYGKDHVKMSERQADLLRVYEVHFFQVFQ